MWNNFDSFEKIMVLMALITTLGLIYVFKFLPNLGNNKK